MSQCRVCGDDVTECLTARERMFNMGGKFVYGLCSDCGSLSLMTPIEDIKQFYPADYYSYKFDYQKPVEKIEHIKAAEYLIKSLNLTEKTSVLDWGAGSVARVYSLYKQGIDHVRAYDPLAESNETPEGVKIQNTLPTDRTFDVVIMSHVIEHVDSPREEIASALKLLNNGGYIVISTPNVRSMAFMRYQENWVQLDAPRHKVIFTPEALANLCHKLRLTKKSINYDATIYGLYMSNAYEKNEDYKKATEKLKKLHEKAEDMSHLQLTMAADYLNAIEYGDQITAIFQKE